MRLDTTNLDHRELNERIRKQIASGETRFHLTNVLGQRYLAVGVVGPIDFHIIGVPGNDLGAFMDGPSIRVEGNVQDCVGNTMSSGTIVVNGDARDLLGHSMRGGRIFVKGDVGYRVGVHMKSYQNQFPVVVVGGSAGDFTGEYMAGGVIVIMNLWNPAGPPVGNLLATGMHGGSIYVRGEVDAETMGREAGCVALTEDDDALLAGLIDEYRGHFPDVKVDYVRGEFRKLAPLSHRPYGRLYAY